ncbi:MAG: hypothetical protein AB4038_20185, partial [Prochloraceae cyanobacterium]
MAKKSKNSKKPKKKKASLSINNQATQTASPSEQLELNQLVALKKVNGQAPSDAVETRSDVAKETEQADPPSQIENAESTSLDAPTKPEHRELQTVAKKELSQLTSTEVKTERENSLQVESAQEQPSNKQLPVASDQLPDKQLPVASDQLPVENKQFESDGKLLTTCLL